MRDHTSQVDFGRYQPSYSAVEWTQAEPWHSLLQRQKNLPALLQFTNSCCFCRAMLSSAMGCVNARGGQHNPLWPAPCHGNAPLNSPYAAAFLPSQKWLRKPRSTETQRQSSKEQMARQH